MSNEKPTHCPSCGSAWTDEEKALAECYDCGYPEVTIPPRKADPLEWDTDDDEAMPNIIR